MKKCPFCAEEIQDEAIKCRYCRETLVVAAQSPSTAQGEPADQSSREWTAGSSTDAPRVPVQPKSSTPKPIVRSSWWIGFAHGRRRYVAGLVMLAGLLMYGLDPQPGRSGLGILLVWAGAFVAMTGSKILRVLASFVIAMVLSIPVATMARSRGNALGTASSPAPATPESAGGQSVSSEQASTPKPSPKFDPAWKEIPEDFVGDNLEQVVQSLLGKEPPAKGEFESTSQYHERLEAERARFVVPEHYVFLDAIFPTLSPYDADRQEFTIDADFNPARSSGSYAIALEGAWKRTVLVVPVRREEAEEFSKWLVGLLYVVRPTQKWPYEQIGRDRGLYGKPTEFRDVRTLAVRSPIEVWAFVKKTRRVIFRYTYSGQEGERVLPTTLGKR